MNPPASTFVRPVVSLCLGLKKTNSKQPKTIYENGALILGGMIGSITAPFAAPLGVSRCRGVQPHCTIKSTFLTWGRNQTRHDYTYK